MRTRFILAVVLALVGVVVVVSASLFVFVIQQRPPASILQQSFQANDFLGTWYNVKGVNSSVTGFLISENQGTYTIDVGYVPDWICFIPNVPCYPSTRQDWGTVTLTVNPPYAHAFYTFQSNNQELESADLKLQLQNRTSIQVQESLQYLGQSETFGLNEQFTKTRPSYLTATTTQWGGAPDFALPVVGSNGLTGQTIRLSSFGGKVILLEFMEPWAPHCQDMAPVLQDLYTKYYQHNANVTFISVAGPWNGPDGNHASASDAAKFIGTYGSTWTYVYDSSGSVMNSEYGVDSVPTFFILGKSGAIVTSFQGEQAEGTLTTAINNAISSG